MTREGVASILRSGINGNQSDRSSVSQSMVAVASILRSGINGNV